MVDALEAVWKVLRPRGLVFDLQPDASYLPTVAVRERGRRRRVGSILRSTDEDVLAAHAARERLVADGRFRTIALVQRAYRTSFESLAAFEADKRSHTPPWRLAADTRPRLVEAWRARRSDAVIETTMRMTMAVLEKLP